MATAIPAHLPSSSTALPLLDRVPIVTGGIGSAISSHLATLGARIVINYPFTSVEAEAQTLAAAINSTPPHPFLSAPRAVAVHCDVSDPAQVKSLFDAADQAFDAQLHILVTCAGIMDPPHSAIADTSAEEFDRIFTVNARGTFACVREAANRLRRGSGGRIVTVSSSLAGAFRPGYGAYTVSKVAVEALTKIVAKELKGTRITANCVAPGPVATEMLLQGMTEEEMKKLVEMNPMGRIGETSDIAPVVGFLATDPAGWITGQVIRVNGGYL